VTPELAQLDFGFPIELLAVDQSTAMIEAVWPGDTPVRRARVGDWCALDVSDASLSLALGDGCFSLLDFPDGYRRFASSLARVLQRGALFSIRLFCRPPESETVTAVLEQLFARRIGNVHVFKWRLAMALHGADVHAGVRLATVWDTFQERAGGALALAQQLGWPREEVDTIDNYRGSSAAYTFPTVAEVVAHLDPDFELLERWQGDYELCERCPQLLFRRR
jgi:hypothetical protein